MVVQMVARMTERKTDLEEVCDLLQDPKLKKTMGLKKYEGLEGAVLVWVAAK